MNKKYSPYLPPGADKDKIKKIIWTLYAGAVLWTLQFLVRYSFFYKKLFTVTDGQRVLKEDAEMPLFRSIADYSETGFQIFICIMIIFAFVNFLSFYQGSKSIYTVKRLGKPMMLWKMSLGYPVFFIALSYISMGVIYGIYYLIYRFVTPEICLTL